MYFLNMIKSLFKLLMEAHLLPKITVSGYSTKVAPLQKNALFNLNTYL